MLTFIYWLNSDFRHFFSDEDNSNTTTVTPFSKRLLPLSKSIIYEDLLIMFYANIFFFTYDPIPVVSLVNLVNINATSFCCIHVSV